VLLLALFALSIPNDAGFLGTDTGGKVATLESMEESGEFDLDVGYRTADVDPEGKMHPLWLTAQFDDKWVQVTTLPMIVVGSPLYSLGGYRLVLLLPMLGAVAAAFGARALARRLGSRSEWLAFWVVGLASPVTIYALDFWEHTLGLAAMTWGVVAVLDARAQPQRWRFALLFGLGFGLAATMRTEAFVYALVAGLVMIWPSLRRLRLGEAFRNGDVAVTGAVGILVVNGIVETAILGSALRSGRAVGAASSGGGDSDEVTLRFKEAGLTLFGGRASFAMTAYLVGATFVILIVLAVYKVRTDPQASRRFGLLALFLQATRVISGLAFVPGALVAGPMASVGLGAALAEPDRRRETSGALLVIAFGSLPLVWAFQYTGGHVAQWGGRYILLTGLLSSVVGLVWLSSADRWARLGAVAIAALVTFSGLVWMWERTNTVADTMRTLDQLDTPVQVSDIHLFWREGGAFWNGSTRLTVVDEEGREMLGKVLDAHGIDRFVWVQRSGSEPPALAGFEVVDRKTIDYLGDGELAVNTLVETG